MVQPHADVLVNPVDRLEQALATGHPGSERVWAENVVTALADLEQVLRQRSAEARSPQKAFSEVDLTRPTLVRRVAELREELTTLAAQAGALRAEVLSAAQAFQPKDKAAVPMDPLPTPARASAVPDFGELRQRGTQLVEALRQFKQDEAGLVIESVVPDIGAGD